MDAERTYLKEVVHILDKEVTMLEDALAPERLISPARPHDTAAQSQIERGVRECAEDIADIAVRVTEVYKRVLCCEHAVYGSASVGEQRQP